MMIRVCDRCGDQILGEEEPKDKAPRKYIVKRTDLKPYKAVDGSCIFDEMRTDFCPVCQRLFEEFMDGYGK